MAIHTRNDESEIAEMVQDGNDEKVVRIIFALLDLKQRDTQQRVKLLTDLGQRYLLLALAREDGRDLSQSETVDTLLDERLARSLSFQAQSARYQPPDEKTATWCHEAIVCLTSAIQQSTAPHYVAVLTRAAASARIGKYQEALTDLEQALTIAATPVQRAEVYYRRGGVLSDQQRGEQALHAFSEAHRICPSVQKYAKAEREAVTRVQV